MQFSAEKILGEMLRKKPHTRDGQFAIAESVTDLVKRFGLGTAEILQYPERLDGSGETYPLVKIISEPLEGNGHGRKLMSWLGHNDTVEPQPVQLARDPMVLHTESDDHVNRTIAYGRGALDMLGGVTAYLCGLQILRSRGNARHSIQVILPSREEAGSEVLYQSLRHAHIEAATIGATTEILVGDTGGPAPLYRGRTGRIGVNAFFRGVAPHSGAVNRDPRVIAQIAHRYFARALDELLDETRGFSIPNTYPGDVKKILPEVSLAIPGKLRGDPRGLSLPDEIAQHFDVFHADPNLAPELVANRLEEYFRNNARIPQEAVSVRLEERQIPFIEPWMTEEDHPLVTAAKKHADTVEGRDVPVVGASGVAEEGLLFHMQGTRMVGWSPEGKDAHEPGEWVGIESINRRAEWLARLAAEESDLG